MIEHVPKKNNKIGGGVETARKGPEVLENEDSIVVADGALILLVGLPGSGKSQFATTNFPPEVIVSTDQLRGELTNNPFNQLISEKAFVLAKHIIAERLKRKELTVFDAQNLAERDRNQFYEIAKMHKSPVEAIFIDSDPAESMRRDAARGNKVGMSYIKKRARAYETARRSVQASPHIERVHIIPPDSTSRVALPPVYAESLAREEELRQEASRAEADIITCEEDLIQKSSRRTLALPAGGILFIEDASESRAEGRTFAARQFLTDQIIDAEKCAQRVGADINDVAVFETMNYIAKVRAKHNLTTVITYPAGFPHVEELKKTIDTVATAEDVKIPKVLMKISGEYTRESSSEMVVTPEQARGLAIEVVRDAPADAPLFLIGDTHGCYEAVRELSGRVQRENLDADAKDRERRKIVFVGDMADRGPHDADTVIYITALVRAGRAILVKGNHDINLLKGLKGEEFKSTDTRKTIAALRERLSQSSIDRIIQMLEEAPIIAKWKSLVAVHASLPCIPRSGVPSDKNARIMTHGAPTGKFVGRTEYHKVHQTTAKDPGILSVSGHTHEVEPQYNANAETVNIDVSAQTMGRLYGMYYPEREFAFAEEPSVLRMFSMLKGEKLPEGKDLLDFVAYAESQGFIEQKAGAGNFDGLRITTYSESTELNNVWEKYPILRTFRGLIIDAEGTIVARPFEKTHKAGDEIPLAALEFKPEKVFEKANGSLGICYQWKGKWHVATKFSFENETYTRPAERMLNQMNTDAFDPTRTYLFEIILPNDAHIVDYGGKEELVLLNAIETKTGVTDPWQTVSSVAQSLGARTAADMTTQFEGMTIAQIYRFAQEAGDLPNLEGMMALYKDENGKDVLIKLKAQEYENKKFLRDHLDWETLFEKINPKTGDISGEAREELLHYDTDNTFARMVVDTRLEWIRERREAITKEFRTTAIEYIIEGMSTYKQVKKEGLDHQQPMRDAMRSLMKYIDGHPLPVEGISKSTLAGYVRDAMTGGKETEILLSEYVLRRVRGEINAEIKKRGKNAFWILPSNFSAGEASKNPRD